MRRDKAAVSRGALFVLRKDVRGRDRACRWRPTGRNAVFQAIWKEEQSNMLIEGTIEKHDAVLEEEPKCYRAVRGFTHQDICRDA